MADISEYPSADWLSANLSYDPDTGLFHWLTGRCKGRQAGSVHKRGYIIISFRCKSLRAHRVAFKMMVGRDPIYIDHIDGDPANNKWSNLREATMSQNTVNSRVKPRDLPRGVRRHGKNGRYWSLIKHNQKNIYLGTFDDVASAEAAYRAKAIELFGDFARAL